MSRQLYLISIVMVIVCVSCNHQEKKNRNTASEIPQSEYSPVRTLNMIFNLEMLLEEESYFKFYTTYSSCRTLLPDKYKLYFDIFQYDLFGYAELLEEQDKRFLRKYYRKLTEKEKICYHFTKISHYQKKYAYNEALSEVVKLDQFAERLDPVALADLQQYHERFSTLLSTPPMTVTKYPGDTILMDTIRSLFYIPVSINGNRMKMVFDTGSGVSLISRSMAENYGLKIYETVTEVMGATGVRSASKLGIAKNMTIGKSLFEHVVFEVVEDSLLGVPEYEFFFDGLVGLDLLYPLGSISLDTEGTLTIHESRKQQIQPNMSLDHFSNRISVKFQEKVLPVKLDTGAWISIFSWRFHDLFKTTSLESCRIQTKEYGGIGGAKSLFDMVHLDSMLFFVDNDSVLLEDAWIHTTSIHKNPVTYFGLMGQDFIGQFLQITLNFNPNSIEYTTRN